MGGDGGGRGAFELLRSAPAFRTLWLSRGVSFVGDGISQVALVLLAAESGPEVVGLVLLANTLPRFLGPVAGAVADRMDHRVLMLACELGQAAVFTLLAVLSPSLPVLLPLVALAGLLATLFAPAGKSSVPDLVPTDRLGQANALLATAFNLQIVLGPALGGVIVAVSGTRGAFLVDAVTFLGSAALITRLPSLRGAAEQGSLLAQTLSGLRYAWTHRVPRTLMVATVLMVAFAAMDNVALVFLVKETFGLGSAAYGVSVAAFGVGMLAGSLALIRLADRWRPERVLAGGFLTGAVATTTTGLAPGLAVATGSLACAGAANSLDLIATDLLVQQRVRVEMRGRVFGAVSTAAQAGSGTAYAVAGPLVAAVGPRTTFVIAGMGAVCGLLVLLPLIASGGAPASEPGPRIP